MAIYKEVPSAAEAVHAYYVLVHAYCRRTRTEDGGPEEQAFHRALDGVVGAKVRTLEDAIAALRYATDPAHDGEEELCLDLARRAYQFLKRHARSGAPVALAA